jgi:hypothetical protein
MMFFLPPTISNMYLSRTPFLPVFLHLFHLFYPFNSFPVSLLFLSSFKFPLFTCSTFYIFPKQQWSVCRGKGDICLYKNPLFLSSSFLCLSRQFLDCARNSLAALIGGHVDFYGKIMTCGTVCLRVMEMILFTMAPKLFVLQT